MPVYTNAQLLEQLRAIGWRDEDIASSYPDLLPDYSPHPTPEPSTLYQRLLDIGWSEERIREEQPDILPESEGGVMESLPEPTSRDEPRGDDVIPGPMGGRVPEWDPDAPWNNPPQDSQDAPPVDGDQTTDLAILTLIVFGG